MSALVMYTVYFRPADFPNSYVVRRFHITGAEPEPDPFPCAIGPTLEDVRSVLPPFLYRLDRQEGDEPHIVETWL